jgi:hypothetical protein
MSPKLRATADGFEVHNANADAFELLAADIEDSETSGVGKAFVDRKVSDIAKA